MHSEQSRPDRQTLAQEILRYSRRYITRQAPLMLVPIYALQEKVSPIPGPLATDGIHLWYDPERVIADFRRERAAPARQLLHVTLHCLLGHWKARRVQGRADLFDAAADWKTARFIHLLIPELGQGLPSRRYEDRSLAGFYQAVEKDPKEGRFLMKDVYRSGLILDDHTRWHPLEQTVFRLDGSGEKGGLQESEDPAAKGGLSAEDGQPVGGNAPNWEGMLRAMSQQVQGTQWGRVAGLIQMELEPAEENQISYANFLQRFAAPNERLLLDPDSFDPRWYYLGLEQYGDIPLLEPSEISEPPLPDNLVLALDTSGSCSGEVCRRFLRETLSLLRDITAGAASFQVLALQCDTQIQKEILLEDAGQLDSFLADFTPTGFGGTDFCPVFDHVARRMEDGTMSRVKGLLYLSDGYGDFPQEPPGYPVTFLLLNEEGWGAPQIPDWVTALYLNTDDFTLKEASV